MSQVTHLAVLAVLSVLAVPLLARARWTWRSPHTAVILWQALGLAAGLSAIGLLLSIGLAPYGRGVVPGLASAADAAIDGLASGSQASGGFAQLGPIRVGAVVAGLGLAAALLGALVLSFVQVTRCRHRHRGLLALVARGLPESPDTLVLDHPAAAAYCLPGMRSRVVVSAGTLRLLDHAELGAVLAHEKAHARGRHDLVLLPFLSLAHVFPRFRPVREAIEAVSLLVEMCADDRARRRHGDRSLAAALVRVGTAGGDVGTPAGTLAVAGSQLAPRVLRLLAPQPALPRPIQALVLAVAATLVATPLTYLALPTV